MDESIVMRTREAAHDHEGHAVKAVVLAGDLPWSMLKPPLATTQTRPERQDDRRIVGGIIKEARRLATRYDTPAKTYRNAICPIAIALLALT